jgi:hypothetical protein
MKINTVFEKELLSVLKRLPENKQQEVIDFAFFLFQRTVKQEEQKNMTNAVLAVEETWGNIPLRREIMKDIAENKELEYDI